MPRLACVIVAAIGCTNSGLGADTTDSGPTTPVPDTSCLWEGTWIVVEAKCSTFAIADWLDTYSETRMEITENPDGGCDIAFSWTGPDCSESETWFAARHEAPLCNEPPEVTGTPTNTEETTEPVEGPRCVDIVSEGITSCDPDLCAFDVDQEVACQVGDRAATVGVEVDESVDGELTISGLLAHGRPTCSLDLVTRWAKQ